MTETAFQCAAPRFYVPAPTVVPPRYGLFSASVIVEESGAHWQNGVLWEPTACSSAGTTECTCADDSPGGAAKTYREGTPLVETDPFTVYGSFTCSPIGRWDDGQARAIAHLLAGEERAVERAIASGESGANPNFTDATDITPAGGTDLVGGIAVLEQYLGENYHSLGVIHMSRGTATRAKAADVLCCPPNGQEKLRTGLGTLVAAGGGYDGQEGPSEPEEGQVWVYATGRPHIRRGEVFSTPPNRENALDTAFNNLSFLAERTYVVGWDCLTAAVLVDIDGGAS